MTILPQKIVALDLDPTAATVPPLKKFLLYVKSFQKKYYISYSLFSYISQIESTYGIVSKK